VSVYQLLGAGGHAKVIAEICSAAGGTIGRYIDPAACPWLGAVEHIEQDELASPDGGSVLVGLGGVTPEALASRLALVQRFRQRGFTFSNACHTSAIISKSASIDEGAHVLASAVVQPDAWIGLAAIVNTGAIVEHDARIAAGAHVAPKACILGSASVGEAAMIGAGAIVLPGTSVPAGTVVPAQSVYKGS